MSKDSELSRLVKNYYNSREIDDYYSIIYGGEFLHIGIYQSPDEAIAVAGQRTIEQMVSQLANKLNKDSRVLDIGAGWGGSARFLAKTYECQIVALNLSELENQRHREKNQEQNLDHLIEVIEGHFENIPFPDNSFEVVFSQDAIIYSGNRTKVFQEVARVLKTGGEFIFTDVMQTKDCPSNALQYILKRLQLQPFIDTLGSPTFYHQVAERAGMRQIAFVDLSGDLITHYTKVLRETERLEENLTEKVSQDYIDSQKQGLHYWIDGGNNGYIGWGILHFCKST